MANIRALGGKIRGSQLVQGIDVDEVTGDVQSVTARRAPRRRHALSCTRSPHCITFGGT